MTTDHKIALITGAGSGIGKHTAIAFLKAGYATVLTGRRLKPLEETIKEAGVKDTPAIAVTCNVGNPGEVASLFSKITKKFGRLDVLFNNAGTNVPPLRIDEITPEQWRTVVDVNLTGAFLCSREAFILMKRQTPMGGRIINNGSISAHAPRPGSAPYTATKHAITGLTKSISLDGRPYDIACGQIDIGNAATDMTTAMAAGVPQANGTMAPEPTMDVKHVADAVIHMAGLPLDVNIQFITIMATKMPLIGRG
jgi:NAD(P)-dependent dehydrogenase (short-subunit alcohol dehydrogenase family)